MAYDLWYIGDETYWSRLIRSDKQTDSQPAIPLPSFEQLFECNLSQSNTAFQDLSLVTLWA